MTIVNEFGGYHLNSPTRRRLLRMVAKFNYYSGESGKIADRLRRDFLPEYHMATIHIRDRRRTLRLPPSASAADGPDEESDLGSAHGNGSEPQQKALAQDVRFCRGRNHCREAHVRAVIRNITGCALSRARLRRTRFFLTKTYRDAGWPEIGRRGSTSPPQGAHFPPRPPGDTASRSTSVP
jgi:hypothetical protein